MAENDKKPQKKYQNQKLFDYLGNILVKKSEEEFKEHVKDSETFKSFPFHVIIRYLSMSEDSEVRNIVLRNQIPLERLDKISHELSYRWFFDNIRKQRSGFIRYVK